MLKEDFNEETTNNQTSDQPLLTELEQKYEKELNEYEEKTHFMQDHEMDFEEGNSSVITKGSTMKNEFSKDSGSERTAERTNESNTSEPVSASELIEKGMEIAREKAGEMWESVKSEWKEDRKEFVRKTLVGTAVTGAAIGLLLLSRRRKAKAGMVERAMNAIS